MATCPSASPWLTAAGPGCHYCFWISVTQVPKFNQVQKSFKVTGTSLRSSVPTSQLYRCQPSPAISFFGHNQRELDGTQDSLKPTQSGATWMWYEFTTVTWSLRTQERDEAQEVDFCWLWVSCHVAEQTPSQWESARTGRWQRQSVNRWTPVRSLLWDYLLCFYTKYRFAFKHKMSADICFCLRGRNWSCDPEEHEGGGCSAGSCCLLLISAGPRRWRRRGFTEEKLCPDAPLCSFSIVIGGKVFPRLHRWPEWRAHCSWDSEKYMFQASHSNQHHVITVAQTVYRVRLWPGLASICLGP